MTSLTTAILATALKPFVSEVYQSAKHSIKDNLKKLSLAQVSKKTAAQLLKLDKVKTIWAPELEISLQKFYFPSRLMIAGQPATISKLSELPVGNLVIEGIVGQGKSIFMRYLAMSSLHDKDSISTVPILVELRKITTERSLADIIQTHLDTLALPCDKFAFDYLAETGKITLLLDGFDEIPSECVSDIIFEIETIQAKHSMLKIIISSRPKSSIQNVTGFGVLNLVQLSDDDYAPFLRKLITSTSKRLEIIRALSECSAHISGVICTPLMLTLVVIVHQTEQEIPSTLPEFFDKLFNTVFSKHDRFKAGFDRQHHSGLSENELKKLFDAFCFMVIQGRGGRSLAIEEFNRFYDKALSYTKSGSCTVERFRKDIVNISCLMLDEGYDTTTFLHKSILDYHAAAFVKALPDITAERFYDTAFNSYNIWKYPLEFLEAIDTTRYLKYYTLKNLAMQLSTITKLIASKDDNELTVYLETIQPDFIYSVDKNLSFIQAGPFHPTTTKLNDTISDQLLEAAMDSVEDTNEEKMNWAISNTQGLGVFADGSSDISIRSIIRAFGSDLLWQALQILESDTLREIDSAEKYLAEFNEKNQFLEDILAGG